jgi:phosphoglycolate phosphatase-like HAD superfamily hydrolase
MSESTAAIPYAIVVDLDGTLCDCAHRVSYAQTGQWDEFHSRLDDDRPHADVVAMIDRLVGAHALDALQLVICSGRNDAYRNATIQWLARQNIWPDVVLLRPNHDYTPDHELKVRLLSEHFGSLENAQRSILCILEDRDKVVEALRNAGFPVWQVRPNSY